MLIEGRDEAESFDLLQDLFQESLTGLLGSRTMEDILTRFTDKLQRVDDPQGIERGIALFSRLASHSRGRGERAAADTRRHRGVRPWVGRADAPGGCAGRLPSALSIGVPERGHRPGAGNRPTTQDGLRHHRPWPGRPRGSVRRRSLQRLVKALGGAEDVPALGFAYTLRTFWTWPSGEVEERHLTSSNSQRR